MIARFLKYFLVVLVICHLASSEDEVDLGFDHKCSLRFGDSVVAPHLLPYEEVPSVIKRLILAKEPKLGEFQFVCATEQILPAHHLYILEFAKSKNKCSANVVKTETQSKVTVYCSKM